jgi:anti-anti-sigma regulatory factor
MPVQFTRVNTVGNLRVVGRLDAQGAAELERAAIEALNGIHGLILDISDATDASPAALRVIVMLDTVMAHRGQMLCICPSTSLICRALEISSVDLGASFAPSVAEAELRLST